MKVETDLEGGYILKMQPELLGRRCQIESRQYSNASRHSGVTDKVLSQSTAVWNALDETIWVGYQICLNFHSQEQDRRENLPTGDASVLFVLIGILMRSGVIRGRP